MNAVGARTTGRLVSDRKTYLLGHKPPCARCRVNANVTLTNSTRSPARWYCARCKSDFEWEPKSYPTADR